MGTEEQFASEDEDDFDEEFAEDEFADDASMSDGLEVRNEGFGPNAFPASELDGWVLEDTPANELEKGGDGDELTEDQMEAWFNVDDAEDLEPPLQPPKPATRSR